MVEEIVNPHTAEWAHLKNNQHCSLTVSTYGAHVWLNPQGQPHRVDESGNQDGPAYIWVYGEEHWCLNGDLHRLDGPALIETNGDLYWYLDDECMTQEEWSRDPRVIEFNSRTPEGAEQWLKRL